MIWRIMGCLLSGLVMHHGGQYAMRSWAIECTGLAEIRWGQTGPGFAQVETQPGCDSRLGKLRKIRRTKGILGVARRGARAGESNKNGNAERRGLVVSRSNEEKSGSSLRAERSNACRLKIKRDLVPAQRPQYGPVRLPATPAGEHLR